MVEYPDSRLEELLYVLCFGGSTTRPQLSRIEALFNCLITGDAPQSFTPLSRNEKILMAIFGLYPIDELQKPLSRVEEILYTVLTGGENLNTIKNPISNVERLLLYAVENGFGICVFTHQVVSGGDPSLVNVGTETFSNFCEYCNQYISRGELVSYNAKDMIGYFTNSDISSVDIRETQFKISRLLENQ